MNTTYKTLNAGKSKMNEWYEKKSSLYGKCITQTKNGMIASVYIITEILSQKWSSYDPIIIDQKNSLEWMVI